MQAITLCWVPGRQLSNTLQRQAALGAFAHHAWQQVLGPTKAGLGKENVVAWVAKLHFVLAARVIRADPVKLALLQELPQRFDIFLRTKRRVDLSANATGSFN